MKRRIVLGLLLLCIGCSPGVSDRYLIILQAGTESHEGLARTVHALLYARELKEAGYEVALIFDGAGTAWAKQLRDPEHKLHKSYEELRQLGVTQIVCDFCAAAFRVKEDLAGGPVPLISEYQGHPSLVKWLRKGYVPLIL